MILPTNRKRGEFIEKFVFETYKEYIQVTTKEEKEAVPERTVHDGLASREAADFGNEAAKPLFKDGNEKFTDEFEKLEKPSNFQADRLRVEFESLDDSSLAEMDESRLMEFSRVLGDDQFQNLKVFYCALLRKLLGTYLKKLVNLGLFQLRYFSVKAKRNVKVEGLAKV